MGNRIGDLLSHIGGPAHSTALIEILEILCGTEEITARTAAASSTSKIISQLNSSHVDQVNDYFEMFKRMSNEEAGDIFYTRVSSCFIVAELYRALGEDLRSGLRDIYMRLVIDELPMVRRAAAQVFLSVANEAEAEVVLDDYLQVMKSFATDEFQTVRVIGTENLLPFLRLLKKLNTPEAVSAASELLPLVKAAGLDLSWRIRLAISKDYGDFAQMFTADEVAYEIFPLGVHLIQDNEPDVRTNVLKGMILFQAVVPQALYIGDLMPIAMHLVEDPYLSARKLLAELCIDIAAKVIFCLIFFFTLLYSTLLNSSLLCPTLLHKLMVSLILRRSQFLLPFFLFFHFYSFFSLFSSLFSSHFSCLISLLSSLILSSIFRLALMLSLAP